MKKLPLLLLLTALLGSNILLGQREAKRFAVKSGHIELELGGSTVGTKTIWFDDYGLKYREEVEATTTTKILGFKDVEENHDIDIMVEDNYINIDMLKGTGSKGKLHFYEDLEEDYYNMTDAEKKEFEEDILNSFGGEKLGYENILGKDCEIVSVMGSKLWIYKGLVLKSEMNVLGQKSNEMTTFIEEDISVPASMFEAPEGVELTQFKSINDIFNEIDEEEKKANEEDKQSMEDADEDNVELAPITYSFDDFKNAMEQVEIEDYPRTSTLNLEEEYMCMFMKSVYNVISIVATSDKDNEGNRIYEDVESKEVDSKVETFTHHGLQMFYGDNIDEEEEEGSMLGIEYPKQEMAVIIGSNKKFSKEELLKIADQLDF